MGEQDKEIYTSFAVNFLSNLGEIYWTPMFRFIKENKLNEKELTGFLFNPEKLVINIGKTHIALEYYGNERLDKINSNNKLAVQVFDYSKENSDNFFEKVVGIKFDSTSTIKFPLTDVNEGLIIPTNKGADKLSELNWNYAAQNSIVSFNTGGYFIPQGTFTRLINCIFFDANDTGLVTRRVKWIDFIPLEIEEKMDEEYDQFTIDFSYYFENKFADLLYEFPIPMDFKFKKLDQINRFIELAGSKFSSEPQITSFLSLTENNFILTMAFNGLEVHSQAFCEWQSEEKQPIKPDFFIVRPNGYADIVEFKLPYLKRSTVVGTTNRERFSSDIQSYIAQTRVYRNYFDDPNNRKWIQEKYGFKIYKPKRYLVVGRRWDFDYDEWQEIKADYIDLEILTYDDLIDGVVCQFYM